MMGPEKLRSWRKGAGLSQGQAAERVKVAQATWSTWELGLKRPELEYILLIEEMTGGAVIVADWVLSKRAQRERRARRVKPDAA